MFVNIGSRASGDASGTALDSRMGLMIQAGSPAVNAGIVMSDNGGLDFFGNTLYNDTPDIGPHELQ